MPVAECVCCFALKQVGMDGFEQVSKLLLDQFSDQGKQLVRALEKANRTAWKALEIALTGETLWSRVADRAAEKAFRQQIRLFLDRMPLPELTTKDQYRQACLKDLRTALRKGVLFGEVVVASLLEKAGPLVGYADPQHVLKLEKQALLQLAREVQAAGFQNLAWLLNQPVRATDSVIVLSVRYFFHREVEQDPQLAHRLQITALEDIGESQREAFQGLGHALEKHGQHLEQALLEAQQQILNAIGDVKAAVQAQGAQVQGRLEGVEQTLTELQSRMDQLLTRLGMLNQPVRAGHSLSIKNDREKQLVKEILSNYRELPREVREDRPGLVSKMGKLLLAAGEFQGAEQYFQRVARLAKSDPARAEAHHNAYRAALEQKQYDAALRELLQASAISPDHFAFSLDRYEPLGILGAGGFGVTFLCRHTHSRGKVAVKSLTVEDMDRDGATVLQEANTLEQVKHPALIGIRDCGYADAEKRRPFLVMEYFDGPTLEEYVGQKGALSPDEALALARILAEGMQAAHGKRLLHRDVKPANILLRKDRASWEVRIIDFGLALSNVLLNQTASTQTRSKTITGGSIAGTIDYAAPEQMGKLAGSRIGPPADVYGFGKTLIYALFGTPEATYHHYKQLPPAMAEFLSSCVQQQPAERPQSFADVLKMLDALLPTAAPAAPPLPAALPVADAPGFRPTPLAEDHQPSQRQHPPRRRDEDEDEERPRRRRDHDEEEDDRPRRRRKVETTTGTRVLHAVLAFLLGGYGVHKFAQGNAKAGVTRLLITLTCIGVYVTVFCAWAEAVKYLMLSNEDYDQAYCVEKRAWF